MRPVAAAAFVEAVGTAERRYPAVALRPSPASPAVADVEAAAATDWVAACYRLTQGVERLARDHRGRAVNEYDVVNVVQREPRLARAPAALPGARAVPVLLGTG